MSVTSLALNLICIFLGLLVGVIYSEIRRECGKSSIFLLMGDLWGSLNKINLKDKCLKYIILVSISLTIDFVIICLTFPKDLLEPLHASVYLGSILISAVAIPYIMGGVFSAERYKNKIQYVLIWILVNVFFLMILGAMTSYVKCGMSGPGAHFIGFGSLILALFIALMQEINEKSKQN